jgi:hypothetical protein
MGDEVGGGMSSREQPIPMALRCFLFGALGDRGSSSSAKKSIATGARPAAPKNPASTWLRRQKIHCTHPHSMLNTIRTRSEQKAKEQGQNK